jgi:hypothetical protein
MLEVDKSRLSGRLPWYRCGMSVHDGAIYFDQYRYALRSRYVDIEDLEDYEEYR